uniref:Uncharacterized protein n=2 Tax=Stomoxys calcitrans TaxID=35570 RepID=A0A1I8PZU2_STOCA
MCCDLCAALFFKPWIKSFKKSLLYGYGGSRGYGYGYNNPYAYGYNRYNNYNNYGYYGGGGRYGSYYGSHRQGHRTGRTYSDIARVINPNPYAFVGSRPYPAQPFYPIGG